MKFFIPISLVVVAIISGCSSDVSGTTILSENQGVHFQGRDCIACHNVDLKKEKNLFIGGTLFKSSSNVKVDDITTTCGGELIVNFLKAGVVAYSSKDYKVATKGNNGKGNLFILDRTNPAIANKFQIEITDINGNTLAKSGVDSHIFSGASYNSSKIDPRNRHSCNSCHTTGGNTSPLFVQQNVNLCK